MAWLFAILAAIIVGLWWFLIRMPGESYANNKPPPPAPPTLLAELKRDLAHLAGTIGERNVFTPKALAAAADWIEAELRKVGYAPERQTFEVSGTSCSNIAVEVPGTPEIVVIGGHYDSVSGCPGANDNGTGAVATLALARRFAGRKTERTLRFVFFVNEEPPWFQGDDMGSLRYARRCRERDENVVAMVSLETIGYFTDEPDSQEYPVTALKAAYGDRGNYVALVSNVASRALLYESVLAFRERAKIPSKGVALFEAVPGVGWSDHWSFWQCGYPAIMLTDTAPFRYPHYHERTDTPDQVRYDEFARVVEGCESIVAKLARAKLPE
jgi:Zn-dependent M28 family amino/carboxypeptidase